MNLLQVLSQLPTPLDRRQVRTRQPPQMASTARVHRKQHRDTKVTSTIISLKSYFSFYKRIHPCFVWFFFLIVKTAMSRDVFENIVFCKRE